MYRRKVKHGKVLEFIASVRESFPDAVEVYTCGSCYRFYQILKQVFPEAVAYYDGHVITKIGLGYYDITGQVQRGPLHHQITCAQELSRVQACSFPSFNEALEKKITAAVNQQTKELIYKLEAFTSDQDVKDMTDYLAEQVNGGKHGFSVDRRRQLERYAAAAHTFFTAQAKQVGHDLINP